MTRSFSRPEEDLQLGCSRLGTGHWIQSCCTLPIRASGPQPKRMIGNSLTSTALTFAVREPTPEYFKFATIIASPDLQVITTLWRTMSEELLNRERDPLQTRGTRNLQQELPIALETNLPTED